MQSKSKPKPKPPPSLYFYSYWYSGCVVIFCLFFFFVIVLLVLALTNFRGHTSSLHDPNNHHHHHAKRLDLGPDIQFVRSNLAYLGKKYDPQAFVAVEGYAFFMRKTWDNNHNFSVSAGVHGTGKCLPPFADGARWKNVEEFIVNPDNDQGLSESDVLQVVTSAIGEWDNKLLFQLTAGRDLNGNTDGVDNSAPDGKNEILFAHLNEPGVLAVTILWGIFSGPVEDRELLEADIVVNLRSNWGDASQSSSVFDLLAILTHEFGHYFGFEHSSNQQATMYFQAGLGETKKRSLEMCEIESLCFHYNEIETCPGHSFTGTIPESSESKANKMLSPMFLIGLLTMNLM